MKAITATLVLLLCVLQYKLWFDQGGLPDVWHLQKKLTVQEQKNVNLRLRNSGLEAEVVELKAGTAALEARARGDLGMVKPGEVYYQF